MITASVMAVVAVGVATAGAGYAFGWWGSPDSETKADATLPRSLSATPVEPPELPFSHEAMFHGAIDSWSIAPNAEIAATLPSAGGHTGSVALAVDAPALRAPTDAAVTSVEVEPGATYFASAWVRAQTGKSAAVPASLVVGDAVVPFGDLRAEWQEVTLVFEAPQGGTTAAVSVRIDAPLSGLAIDDVSVRTADGGNLVPNPSFEAVAPDAILANDSLVMSTATASLAVAPPAGDFTWQLTDDSGVVVTSGAETTVDAVTPVPLIDVPQGYYTATIADAEGGITTTPIALVDTAGAAVPRDARFGVTAQFDRPWHEGGGRLAAALGYGDLHADVLWNRNEKTRGSYTWDEAYLTEFAAARANGLSTVGVIAYGNKLYDGGVMTTSADGLDAYGRYAAAAARTLELSAVEVFNEPNKDRFNKSNCGTAPTCYIPLLDAVRRNLQAQGVSIPIIGGATALYDQEWFTAFWQAGGMNHLDVLSFHPYEGWIQRDPDLMRPTIAQSIADMTAHAGDTRPIWITEMGFTTMNGGVTLPQQRDWLIRSEALALAGGAQKYMWYDIVDDAADPANGEGNFGLYEHAPRPGVAVVAPKPSAYAQALMVSQLNGREVAADESDAGSNVVRFGDGAEALRIAWSVADASSWTFPSESAVRVVASSGRETVVEPAGGQVTVDLSGEPVFVTKVVEPVE